MGSALQDPKSKLQDSLHRVPISEESRSKTNLLRGAALQRAQRGQHAWLSGLCSGQSLAKGCSVASFNVLLDLLTLQVEDPV
ncbi:MAG TPA: hypothetical protein DDX92_03655 [Flavobacteriales bacterium]|nr:hypothetical protein [Flavobacteriales bacterium]